MLNLTAGKLFLFATIFALLGVHSPGTESKSNQNIQSSKKFSCATALDLFTQNNSSSVPIWVTYTSSCDVKPFKVGANTSKAGILGYDQDIQITIQFPFGANAGRIRIYNNGSTNQVGCVQVSSSFTTYYFTVTNAVSDAIWVYYDEGINC
jgi:hypothetical protein